MIYRTFIEGLYGSPYDSQSECIYIFFTAFSLDQAREKRDKIFNELAGNKKYYEVAYCQDEIELHSDALEPEAFPDAHLLENGSNDDTINYVDDALLFLIAEDRQRLIKALAHAKKITADNAQDKIPQLTQPL